MSNNMRNNMSNNMNSETFSMVKAIQENPKVKARVTNYVRQMGHTGLVDIVIEMLYDADLDASSTPDGVWVDDERIDWKTVASMVS